MQGEPVEYLFLNNTQGCHAFILSLLVSMIRSSVLFNDRPVYISYQINVLVLKNKIDKDSKRTTKRHEILTRNTIQVFI